MEVFNDPILTPDEEELYIHHRCGALTQNIRESREQIRDLLKRQILLDAASLPLSKFSSNHQSIRVKGMFSVLEITSSFYYQLSASSIEKQIIKAVVSKLEHNVDLLIDYKARFDFHI